MTKQNEKDLDEDTDETADTAADVPAVADDKGDEVAGLRAATAAERRKRQELEGTLSEMRTKLAYLEGRVASPAPKDAEPEEDDPVDFENLAGWAKKVASKAVDRDRKERETKIANERESEWKERLSYSIEDARESHDDFDEVATAYLAMEKANPALARKIRLKADPAEWAYQYAKKHSGSNEVENLKKEIEELRAQVGGSPPQPKSKTAGLRGHGSKPIVTTDGPDTEDLYDGR